MKLKIHGFLKPKAKKAEVIKIVSRHGEARSEVAKKGK